MKALIIVDVQKDFLPGGALAVPNGDRVIPVINRLQKAFKVQVATHDMHPPKHISFASAYGMKPFEFGPLGEMIWPDHCVAGTTGAQIHPDVLPGVQAFFAKGTHPDWDSYSGFYDREEIGTGLALYLREKGVGEVYICGLATDYCVKATALDAVKLGFKTHVVLEACAGVATETTDAAVEEMKTAGVKINTADGAITESGWNIDEIDYKGCPFIPAENDAIAAHPEAL
jgi:nicotinamidase/pyrazinamidase